jgi:hypothetical protein
MSTTGSVDIFKYNPVTDQHDLLLTLYRGSYGPDKLFLAEDPSGNLIHTDIAKRYTVPIYSPGGIHSITLNVQDIPIEIDAAANIIPLEDDYGHALDVYNNVLAVGCRWFLVEIDIEETVQFLTGSAVDIYDLSKLNSTFFDSYVSTGSGFFVTSVLPPPGDQGSGSFGFSVGINDEWLAVGSPDWFGTGSVHMYRRTFPADKNNIDFVFYQTITGSNGMPGDQFGYSIDTNKQTGSYSGSLVVGCGRRFVTSSFAYFFEFDGYNWKEKNTFTADRTLQNLPFYDVNPVLTSSYYVADGYSNAVAIWEDDLAVGAPTDRVFYEYSGSSEYKQGAAYLYHRCSDHNKGWYLVEKTYGNEKTLKNNKLGFSLSLWGEYFALGVPKFNMESLSPCYIEGSIWQDNYCYNNPQDHIQGQWMLFQINTESVDRKWDIKNVYQRKKRFLEPYKAFGYDIDISNKSVVVGAPLLLNSSDRDLNIENTASVQGDSILELKDVSGKGYIYNLKNLRDYFHVGNVFYRNGKIVLNTSGSLFDGIWFNPINYYNYEYQVHFNSKQTLYEKQIACVVEPGEFNTSQNPTAVLRPKSDLDINNNGYFDWQDLDVILRYMQSLNTQFDQYPTTDWSSSLLTTDEEVSFYNYNSDRVSYNIGHDFLSQSFFNVLNNLGVQRFDFNQDSKVDLNDLNILWKYYSNRLTQTNYHTYITPNSQRKLFSDIIDHLDISTQRNSPSQIRPEFFTFSSQSMSDKTGSYLAPYVTTIGLYSGLDLVATAKVGSPIKLTGDYPVNFLIKIDF